MDRARALIFLACWLGGSPIAARAESSESDAERARRAQVVVHGDGVSITVGRLEDAVANQPASVRMRYRDKAELRAFVDSLVQSELLANEAEKRGYGAEAQVRHFVKDSAAQALVRGEIDAKVTPESVPVEDVRTYYEAHPTEFHRVAMRRGSQIIVDTDADVARLLPEAAKADARMFAEIAKSNSKDPETKIQGGDLGYCAEDARDDPPRDKTQPTVQPAIRTALFALREVGDTTKKSVELGTQRAIVRYTAERPERHVSLEDATLSIRAKLWRERRQQSLDQLYARLRGASKPQIFTDRIYKISFDDMEKRPAGFAPDPLPSQAAKAANRAGGKLQKRTP